MDLVEDNRRITPRDYLELALRPVQGSGRDIAAKNEVLDGHLSILWFDDLFSPLFRLEKKLLLLHKKSYFVKLFSHGVQSVSS